ncbi:MAG TPA: Flp family type IVb pilin [Firmicutes bacterium]|nr:Flp family type IVb pilin [Candidatus Fermentithermobacillaceae bacterium]
MFWLYTLARSWERAFTARLKAVFKDQKGATVAEYALLLALVVIALIGVLGELGTALQGKIRAIIDQIKTTP